MEKVFDLSPPPGYDEPHLLSRNPLSETWIAMSPRSRRKVLVKTAAAGSDLDNQAQVSILTESYRLQRSIKCGRLVTARKLGRMDSGVAVEYPYLDTQVWQPLDRVLSPEMAVSALLEMALILDFLHSRQLVHCDVKLGNFLARMGGAGPDLVLTDLEFLTRDGSDPNARLFGAPDHIAPEIERNERVDIRSDNYSLGVALRGMEGMVAEISTQTAGALARLIEALSEEDFRDRPSCLINLLYRVGLIDSGQQESLWRRLLEMQLVDTLRRARSLTRRDKLSFSSAFLDNYIYGLSSDFLAFLDLVASERPSRALRELRQMLSDCSLNYDGRFWWLEVADDRLLDSYAALDPIVARGWRGAGNSEVEIRSVIHGLYRDDRVEPAWLLLSQVIRSDGSDSEVPLFVELGRRLGRSEALVVFLGSHFESRSPLQADDVPLIYDLSRELLTVQRYTDAAGWIRRGLQETKRHGMKRWWLKFRIYEAHLAGSTGDAAGATADLVGLEDEARSSGFAEEEISALFSIGQIAYGRRELADAEAYLLRARQRAEEIDSPEHILRINAILANIYIDRALFKRATVRSKAAIAAAAKSSDRSLRAGLYQMHMWGMVRLCEFNKAAHWLQRAREETLFHNSLQRLMLHHLNWADLEMSRGRLRLAESILWPVVEPSEKLYDATSQAMVWQNLGEIAALRGDAASADRYLERAGRLYDRVDSQPGRLKVQMLGLVSRLPESCQDERDEWRDCYERLVKTRQLLFAGRCLLYMILYSDGSDLADLEKRAASIRQSLLPSGSPIMKALALLLDGVKREGDQGGLDEKALKQAYRALNRSGQFDLTGRICELLAVHYQGMGSHRLGYKFLRQAETLIRPLENSGWSDRLRRQRETVRRPEVDRTRLIDSFSGVSEILGNISDAHEALDRLVRFAAEETGAERAVLMLRKGTDSSLRTVAGYDCDESLARDAEQISSSVSMDVFRSDDPVLVDEAVADPRTRNYKSIMRHNIQSVACVPLRTVDGPTGVLYLDHHTIPAVFDNLDFAYIKAIAGFVSAALGTINRYRKLTIINRDLLDQQRRIQGEAERFIGESGEIREIMTNLPLMAASNAPVLLLGESGTGKEIMARLVHALSPRENQPMVTVNCSAIPLNLAESEIFGIGDGVATGVGKQSGRLMEADGGSLFLDEIGEMPLAIQPKLLRVVEGQKFSRTGSSRVLHADVRFIFATNSDLGEKVRQRQFRNDLYQRIKTLLIELPPLRNRPGDIPLLTDHFLELLRPGAKSLKVHRDVLVAFEKYSWPGNVRELKNVLERMVILCRSNELTADLLPDNIRLASGTGSARQASSEEAVAIRDALIEADGNRTHAARILGMARTTFLRKMKNHGLS